MAAPKSTVWELEPHTRAKHEILKRYLNSWAPILGQSGFKSFLYIDGFSGPGRYSKGEIGSPIIAIKTALRHSSVIQSKVLFYFVEHDKARASMLDEIINDMSLPKNFRWKVKNDEFEVGFDELISFYRERNIPFPPTFAFIDPFGWKGVPFSIVKEILSHRSCEVFINFMYEEVNRFLSHKDQVDNFDKFFGTSEWKDGIKIVEPRERNRFLHDLYHKQLLQDANAKYVRSFEMKNASSNTDYFLFYATNSKKGIMKMKEAMWKVDESGEFQFSDATDPNQMILFSNEPNFSDLEKQIVSKFSGSRTTVEEIENFVLTNTAYRETHFKRQILRELEISDPPRIEIINPLEKRRKGTFADPQLQIRFS